MVRVKALPKDRKAAKERHKGHKSNGQDSNSNITNDAHCDECGKCSLDEDGMFKGNALE